MAAITKMFSAASTSTPKTPDSGESGEGLGTEPKTPEAPRVSAIGEYFTNLADCIVNVPPYLGRARVPQVCKWRDKEGLLGEIIDLKEAVDTSAIHLAEHKHEYIRRLAENRFVRQIHSNFSRLRSDFTSATAITHTIRSHTGELNTQ